MPSPLSRLIGLQTANVAATPVTSLSFLPDAPAYPLVVKAGIAGLILPEWIKENRALVDEKLAVNGAILFRGFEVVSVERFQRFIAIFDSAPLAYTQRSSPRFEVAKNVYHSTTYPADQAIHMHSENSYAPTWSRRIAFCCIRPADEQGETPIADNRLVVRALDPEIRKKFLEKGVRYIRNMTRGVGLPWQEVFQTNSREEVEKECREQQMRYIWDGEDRLILSWENQAICRHPVTGEEIWFNHAFFFHKNALPEDARSGFTSDADLPFRTCYGDGSEIAPDEAENIRLAYEKATIRFPWERGDVLLLDNMLMAHGRSPYKGERQIIVSLF
jgi:alpha-ketoglutarate-dependent taurine dioxygenase